MAIEQDPGRIEQRYGEVAMPTGILFGTADRVIDIRIHGQSMRSKIEKLDFEHVEGAGHMPQFVEPKRVVVS